MRMKRAPTALILAALAAYGCGGDDTSDTSGGTTTTTSSTTTTDPPKPQAVIDIAVDANRDGKVDPADATEQDHENEWSVDFGASFLANLDDDDGDKVRDADDAILNGPNDELDLSPIVVSAWPEAPDGAAGFLHIDPVSAENVRVWKKQLDGVWVLAGGGVGPCNAEDPACTVTPDVTLTIDEVRAGVTLGIEARFFRRSLTEGWNGIVQLGFEIKDAGGAPITNDALPNGLDEAKIRVAPWLLFGNTSNITRVFSNNVMPTFVAGLTNLTGDAGSEYKKITNWTDHWTQDYFQTGWTSIPGEGGAVKGMTVGNARPWGRCDAPSCWPINWLKKGYLGPDAAMIEIYKKAGTGSTFDSHGNHDLIPPYEFGEKKYPYGRIIHGSSVLKETRDFYAAQEVQGPQIIAPTAWLWVGHIDEVFSYVPANTPRGWKLLVGSCTLARQMLEDAQAAGNGAVTMFKGKEWFTQSGDIPAEISIDDVLANQDLMASSQESQAEIDALVDLLKKEVGLTDDEIIEMPYLIEDVGGGMLAYNPGTANSLVVGNYIGIPKPYGPVIGGVDIFEADLSDRLGSAENGLGSDGQGLEIEFVPDWEWYHALSGEVHCGSNIDGPVPATETWWKVLK